MTRIAGGATPVRAPRDRVVGIDVARGLAILGMIAAHTITSDAQETLVDGRSSVLFAVLAGVSLGLLSGGSDPSDDRAAARGSIALRALVLILLGLLLNSFGSGVAIILDYYGVGFLLVLPLLFARRLVLLAAAAAAAVVGPPLLEPVEALERLQPAIQVWSYWLVTGYYPMLTWIAYLLIGLAVARSGIDRIRTQVAITGWGLAGMVAGYGGDALLPYATAAAHSNSTLEVLGSGGFALFLTGTLCLVTSPRTSALGAVARAIGWPVAAAGAMPLTIYSGQILALAVWWQQGPNDAPGAENLAFFLALAVGSLLFASVWRALLGTGPLERVMRLATRRRRWEGTATPSG